ncbi:hypothetical protein NliqN6_5926 [Naganishia liquefaciens]|uniref:Uncharacterized protein n=1 Tax=Naganishia liquefaciens TaxID=104408 RepID=A0A8H3U0G6_9TREE|nr:hypothetical protein NliqN6_5926 [Naganishia liquefaciens]
MPRSGKQRNNLCNNVRRGTNPVHQPSQELQATEFIRKTLVNKETDLERFRQGDVGYISELLESCRKAGKHPARYRRAGAMTDKFNQTVRISSSICLTVPNYLTVSSIGVSEASTKA